MKRFTLIELLIVLSIISIMISTAAYNSQYFTRKANDTRILKILNAYRAGVSLYFLDHKEYPASLSELAPKYISKYMPNAGYSTVTVEFQYDSASGQVSLKVISGEKYDYMERLYEDY